MLCQSNYHPLFDLLTVLHVTGFTNTPGFSPIFPLRVPSDCLFSTGLKRHPRAISGHAINIKKVAIGYAAKSCDDRPFVRAEIKGYAFFADPLILSLVPDNTKQIDHHSPGIDIFPASSMKTLSYRQLCHDSRHLAMRFPTE